MSFWTLLGYGWIIACFVLGVLSIGRGFSRFLVWCSLGAAMWGLHSTGNHFMYEVPTNLVYSMHLAQGLSLALLIWAFGYAIKRSLKSE